MIVDAHTHLGPALPFQNPMNVGTSGADVVRIMDSAEIDKACVFAPLWIGGEFFDPDFKKANQAIYVGVQEFPDRLIGYARVNPKDGAEALEELDRCIEVYGFRGLKLHPDTEGYRTSDLELMSPVFERLAKEGWVAFFHSGYFPTCQPALFAPLAEAFPTVPMILAHIGYRHWEDAAILATLYPNIYLETAGNSAPATINGSIRVAGADRVLFGTDSPYHAPLYCRDKIELLPDLSGEEREKIMGANMARLLRLNH